MYKPVYVYLYPQNMDAINAENFHIIEAEYDAQINNIRFPYGITALDGQFDMKPKTRINKEQILPHNDDQMRVFLAERQNYGDQVCANCVRHFYADSGNA